MTTQTTPTTTNADDVPRLNAVVWAQIDLFNVPETALQDLEDAMGGWGESGQLEKLEELAEWLEKAECFKVFQSRRFGRPSSDYDPEDDDDISSYTGVVFIDTRNEWAMIRTLATTDADLPPELDFDQLAAIARAWPWSTRAALARVVARAEIDAGIDRPARRAVQAELMRLFGKIEA